MHFTVMNREQFSLLKKNERWKTLCGLLECQKLLKGILSKYLGFGTYKQHRFS